MSELVVPGGNWSREAARLRQAGFALPNSPTQARLEAKRVAESAQGNTLVELANRKRSADMRRRRLATQRNSSASGSPLIRTAGGSNLEMALPKIRQPLGSLMDKGVPFNIADPKELVELRRWCNPPHAPIWMADHTFKPIGEVRAGDDVLGWGVRLQHVASRDDEAQLQLDIHSRFALVKSRVLAVSRRTAPEIVEVSLESGRVIQCTPDHRWLDPTAADAVGHYVADRHESMTKDRDADYITATVGAALCSLTELDDPPADHARINAAGISAPFGDSDRVLSVKSLGPGEVVSLQTTTGNYVAWGYASRNCRLFYSTHDLIPLLVDIYSKLPVNGIEFVSKDRSISRFYEEMFLDDLNYEEFLPDCLLREYFVVGECTALAHFDEQLGSWSSEEILNPDRVRVSKSMFVQQERVQLMVKEIVESLRSGPGGATDLNESPSEAKQRRFEYEQLVRNYPEIINAASNDDALDISDALVSRIVNKASPWDAYGTPMMLRSFRTLMMEESLNSAADAVCDRLYSPLILATLGIENMGDNEPWIPEESDLDDFRDDMQQALAADFKLLVHNFGVDVKNVFGRESVPRFDEDYERIEQKLMQAWGIGPALIMGGAGTSGAYASSALNREVCDQLMKAAQRKAIRHMKKRMEVIADAQAHYDYELKGDRRVPMYREIVEDDPDTGEERIVRVPKLLIPEVRFRTLNLRDESQERAFVAQLKQMGVPISDGTLAVNIPIDFEQELEHEAQETIDKGLATAQAFKVLQNKCDEEGLAYPQELVMHLQATLQLRQALAQTDMAESQTKMLQAQSDAMSPAGQMGILPQQQAPAGQPAQPAAPMSPMMALPADPTGDPTGVMPAQGMPSAAAAPMGAPPAAAPPMSMAAAKGVSTTPPHSAPPTVDGPSGGFDIELSDLGGLSGPRRNFSRPEISDEQRANAPRAGRRASLQFGPSTASATRHVSERFVEEAVLRRELLARHGVTPLVSELINDPDFYRLLGRECEEDDARSDWMDVCGDQSDAENARDRLQDMLNHYEDRTGIFPVWD